MSRSSNSAEDRAINKFYDLVRSHLDDIETLSDCREIVPARNSGEANDFKDEDLYGQITDHEFRAILGAYNEESQKSTVCDRFEAGSFAKLLFSKPGFHNPGATAHLIQDLKIKDFGRSSFLGGHSTYKVSQGGSLDDIKSRQLTLRTSASVKRILDGLDTIEDLGDIDVEIKELSEENPRNGNVYIALGRYNMRLRQFTMAIDQFKKGLQLGCDQNERASKYLSESLFHRGLSLFSGGNYEQAQEYFVDSLQYNPHNQESRFHFDMCSEKIAERRRPFGTRNLFQSRRK